MTSLPSEVSYGTVIGKLIQAVADTGDVDLNPDSVPVQGKVTFTPTPPAILSTTSTPPVIIIPQPITVDLDSTGSFSVNLVATDDPYLNPSNWAYQVQFQLIGVKYAPFYISVPAAEVTDLATVVPTDSTTPSTVTFVGPPGPPGIPPGGDIGQVPTKASTADFDITWTDGAPDPHIDDIAGDSGTTDDAEFILVAVRPPGDPNAGQEIGTILRASLKKGLYSPVLLAQDSVTQTQISFTEALDAGRGWPFVFTVGDSDEIVAGVDASGAWRVANHWPWVLWGDSMLGKLNETLLTSLRAKLGNYPVIQQAYSGDMPQWISARQGGTPPGVRVLNSRNETLKQGVIPASGDVSIVVSPQLGATDLQPFIGDIAGVAGIFQPLQVAGIADPTDPGNIPYNYNTGIFTRRTPGTAVIVPDGTPFKTGYRYRNFRTWIAPSRHAFYRRYVNITIPAAATGGTFKLAYNAQVTGNITWSADDATLMGNMQTAMRALTGASTVFVTQGFIDGTNTPDRNFCIQFDDNDISAVITVNTNALTGTTNPITTGTLGDGIEDTIDCVQAMVNSLTDLSRQHLVISDTGPNSAETLGTVRRARFDALNDALRDVFGPYFWPGFRMLRDSTTMASFGYTATSNDLTDIANGITPRQLRLQDDGTTTDSVHLGPTGYDMLTSLFAIRADARRDFY